MALPLSGQTEVFYARKEVTFDAISNAIAAIPGSGGGGTGAEAFAGANAVKLVSLTIEPSQDWHPIDEQYGSATLPGELEGARGGTFSAVARLRTNNVGVAPPTGVFFEAGCSAFAANAYALSDAAPTSMMLMKNNLNTGKWEMISGAWVETIQVTCPENNEHIEMVFSGGFASYAFVLGAPAVGAAGAIVGNLGDTIGDTTIQLATNAAKKIQVGALIKFGSEDNSGAGYVVTGRTLSNDRITINDGTGGGLTNALTGDEAITPVVPTASFSGTARGNISSTLTIGGTAVGFISYQMTFNTGIQGLTRESSSDRATGVVRAGDRTLEGVCEFYLKDENSHHLGGTWNGTEQAILATLGVAATAGSRLKVNCPTAQLKTTQISAPKAEVMTYSASFMAHSGTAAAEGSYTFD